MKSPSTRQTPSIIILCSVLLSFFFGCERSSLLEGPVVTIDGIQRIGFGGSSTRVILSDSKGNVLEEKALDGNALSITIGEDLSRKDRVGLFQVHFVRQGQLVQPDETSILSFTNLEHSTMLSMPSPTGYTSVSKDRVAINLENNSRSLGNYWWYLSGGEKSSTRGRLDDGIPAKTTLVDYLPEGNNPVFSFIHNENNPNVYYWAFWDSIPSPSEQTFNINDFQRGSNPEQLVYEGVEWEKSFVDIYGEKNDRSFYLYTSDATKGFGYQEYHLPGLSFDSYTSTLRIDLFQPEQDVQRIITKNEPSFNPKFQFTEDLVSDVSSEKDGYSYTGQRSTDGVVAYLSARNNEKSYRWTVLSPGVVTGDKIELPPLRNLMESGFVWEVDNPLQLGRVIAFNTSEVTNYLEFIPYYLAKQYAYPEYGPGYMEEIMSVGLK